MNIKAIIKQIDKRKASIAAERDRLDELISEAEMLRDNCDSAYASLEDARDSLSELV